MADENIRFDDDQIEDIVSAVRSIAHGETTGPGGLEGLAMALAGDRLHAPVGASLDRIAAALEDIATNGLVIVIKGATDGPDVPKDPSWG